MDGIPQNRTFVFNTKLFYLRDIRFRNQDSDTVMILGVCQGHSSISSFFVYWQARLASLCNSKASC